ncbi:MAG: hypothetical protein ACE5JH_07940 [Acidobacteriota bacterium]
MRSQEAKRNPVLRKMIEGLVEALGERLHGVVLYGSAARGDFQSKTSDFNLIVVLESLDPASLEAVGPVLKRWRRQGQPLPRLFSPTLIAESADVFPIEFLDIRSQRVVLHGRDPFADVEIRLDHLRLQCEKELREKMMRLREGYIEAHGSSRELRRLLATSYTTFVALFRGCLHLLGGSVPVHNREVVAAFCEKAGVDRGAFEAVDRLKRGEQEGTDPKALFSRYYDALGRAVHAVDRFRPGQGGGGSR